MKELKTILLKHKFKVFIILTNLLFFIYIIGENLQFYDRIENIYNSKIIMYKIIISDQDKEITKLLDYIDKKDLENTK